MNDPIIGLKLGDYVIQTLLGKGGMARVYVGFDERLQRSAAVKVIDPALSREDLKEYQTRFEREARAIARLSHPNIVGVYQFGDIVVDDLPLYFMAMVFIEGSDLRQIMREAPKQRLSHEDVLNIVNGIGAALDYAHANGVIHRDVKPSNIMLTAQKQPILTDFGLALSNTDATRGDTFGSAHYIAPEQAVSSKNARPQSDLYSLGVVTYEMLVGKVPFDDPSAMSVALKHISDMPPSPLTYAPDLPLAVEAVMYKILDKDPDRRYESGETFFNALAAALLDDEAAGFVPYSSRSTRGLRDASMSKRASQAAKSAQSYDWVEMDDTPADEVPTQELQSSFFTANPPPVTETLKATRTQRGRNRGPFMLALLAVAALVVAILVIAYGRDLQGITAQVVTATSNLTPSRTIPTVAAAGPTLIRPTRTASATRTQFRSATPLPTNTRPPSRTPLPPSNTPQSQTSTEVVSPVATRVTLQAILPSKVPTITPTPTVTGDVLLIYNSEQLVLINITEDVADVSELTFVQEGTERRTYAASRWNAAGVRYSPSALASGWCFQLAKNPDRPQELTECRPMAGFRLVNEASQFWVAQDASVTQFEVYAAGQKVATCTIAAGRCAFLLSRTTER